MKNEAVLMDIKRFAVHDGPGIRTTLFLKGCSLKCIWCHNPEGIRSAAQIAYYEHKCLQCGECAKVCPADAHRFSETGHLFARENCIGCGRCEKACLGSALTLFGRQIDPEEAYRIATEDAIFYRDTGGITVSGGEPLLNPDFILALFTKLKANGFHTAVDTCGNVPWESFAKVLPVTDLFLYDIKHIDPEAHRRLTGTDNLRILENIRKLSESGANIEVRMPLVPQSNDSEETLRGIGAFLKDLNITRMKILPYHSMARSKYTALGMPDTMPDVPSPTDEALQSAVALLRSFGINAISGRE